MCKNGRVIIKQYLWPMKEREREKERSVQFSILVIEFRNKYMPSYDL